MAQKSITGLLFIIVGAFLCSCQKNIEPDTPAEPVIADYTVMVYGCGGGNLDSDLITNMVQSLNYGSTEKVNITWQINLSKLYQDSPMGGTVRFVVPTDPFNYSLTKVKEGISDIASYVKPEKVSDTPLHLYDPQVLSEYIDWAAKECPAHNYIFVIWDHGYCWTPEYERTKSAIFDDNADGLPMSINEFVEGVKRSSVDHFAVVYNDACLSCQMEYYTEYAAFADYAIGSANPAGGTGGRYNVLLQLLNGVSDIPGRDLESALKTYCDAVAYSWGNNMVLDVSLFNLKKLEKMNELLKEMVEAIVKNYPDKKEQYDEAVKNSMVYFYEKGKCIPEVDLYSLLLSIDDRTCDFSMDFDTMDSDISEWFEPYRDSCEEALYSKSALVAASKSKSVHFGVAYFIGDEYAAAAPLYEATAFHKATGWGRVLSTFQQPLSEENNILNRR